MIAPAGRCPVIPGAKRFAVVGRASARPTHDSRAEARQTTPFPRACCKRSGWRDTSRPTAKVVRSPHRHPLPDAPGIRHAPDPPRHAAGVPPTRRGRVPPPPSGRPRGWLIKWEAMGPEADFCRVGDSPTDYTGSRRCGGQIAHPTLTSSPDLLLKNSIVNPTINCASCPSSLAQNSLQCQEHTR